MPHLHDADASATFEGQEEGESDEESRVERVLTDDADGLGAMTGDTFIRLGEAAEEDPLRQYAVLQR